MGKHQATTLVMTPEELAALPVVQVEGEPDIWLTSGEKQKWGCCGSSSAWTTGSASLWWGDR